jgi:predicted nucleic acid-binding protein
MSARNGITPFILVVTSTEGSYIFTNPKDATIVAPPSIDWEVGNAFSAMLKRSRITLEQAIEAIEVYQEISLEIVEIDLKEAVRLAGKHNIYAYDAYILRCAIEHDLPLISLDQNMIDIAAQEGIQVIKV